MPHDYKDQPIAELLPQMDKLIGQGGKVYLKWTCPRCGDRCAANEPNTYHTGGYVHEERKDGSPCGEVYRGEQFGMMVLLGLSGESPS